MSKKIIVSRTGRPINIAYGEVKMQLSGGYSELDSEIVDKIMQTPQAVNIKVLSEKEALERNEMLKKSETDIIDAEKLKEKTERDNLKKMQDAIKLQEIKLENIRKETNIIDLKSDISALKELIKSSEKDIKIKEKELASLTTGEAEVEVETIKEVGKIKKGGK